MREWRCRDAGYDCDMVLRGETVDELMEALRPHARRVHLVTLTPSLQRQLSTLVREV